MVTGSASFGVTPTRFFWSPCFGSSYVACKAPVLWTGGEPSSNEKQREFPTVLDSRKLKKLKGIKEGLEYRRMPLVSFLYNEPENDAPEKAPRKEARGTCVAVL
jgi:hypothetical protein